MKRTLTPDQQAKTDARRAQFSALAKQVAALTDAQRHALAARMTVITVDGHTLSVHNACLVALQRPDATIVGGFNQWKAHGRIVRKGEHSLMAWAPTAPTSSPDPETTESETRPRFITIALFDVTQTDSL